MFSRHYGPALLWSVFIMILMGIPGNALPEAPRFMDLFQPDKLVHLFLFGVMATSILYGMLSVAGKRPGPVSLLITFLIVSGYGALTEFLQATVFTGRLASVWDFTADAVGGLTGIAVYHGYLEKFFMKWKGIVKS